MSDQSFQDDLDGLKVVLHAAIECVEEGDLMQAALLARRAAVSMETFPNYEVEVAYEDTDGIHVERIMVNAPSADVARVYAEEEVRALLGSSVSVTSALIG